MSGVAEAIGITSGIIAIVDATVKVYAAATDASGLPEAFRDIKNRLPLVHQMLQAVHDNLKTDRDEELCKAIKPVLENCKKKADRLNEIVEKVVPPPSASRMKRFLLAVRTIGKGDKVEKLIGGILHDIDLLTSNCVTNLPTGTAIADLIQGPAGLGASKNPVPVESVADNAAFNSSAEGDAPKCYLRTRIDLLRQIYEWADPSHERFIFWLNGVADTGKSTISRTEASAFAERDQLGASFFFFKRGDGDRGRVDKFFTTIASQLAVTVPAVATHVRDAINSDPGVVRKAMTEQFEKFILGQLSKVPQGSRSGPLVLVIDALDECDEWAQEEKAKQIISLFNHLKELKSVCLKVFVISRPELPIRLGFTAIHDSCQDLVLHEIPEQIVQQDIAAYLQTELTRVKNDFTASVTNSLERRLPPDWPSQPTICILVDMAAPLFIFAATVCRFLKHRRCGDPDDQLKVVLEFGTRSQRPKLNAAYFAILNQLIQESSGSPPLTAEERDRIIEDFRTIVGSIINLASPLPVASLAHLFNLPETKIHSRLDFLDSALSVPPWPSPMRLRHLPFRDFLVDPRKQGLRLFWIDEKQTHKHLAAHCLRVMDAQLRPDPCELRAPGTPRSAINPHTMRDSLSLELQYACLYWAYHVDQAKITLRDHGEHHEFLCRHFLHWLEALGLMGRASESIGILTSLQSLVEPKDNTELSRFVRDGLRIAMANSYIIDLAPLQIYSSVLAFAPHKSIIRQVFETEIPKWMSPRPEPEDDWGQCLRVFEGHSGPVSSVAFSPDAALVASASEDKTVRLWRARTGECVQVLKGHSESVSSVAFSPDGAFVASTSNDSTVRLWSAVTGRCVQVLKGHSGWVRSVAFSPDAVLVASASSDDTVRLWRAGTGECVQVLKGHSGWVNSVALSPDAALVASASGDGTIRLWRAGTGECVQVLKGHSGSVSSVAFSPDAALVASASGDSTVRLWRAGTGECVQVLRGHSIWASSVAFSPDAGLLASASGDNTVRLWRAGTGECVEIFKGHSGGVNSVTFSPDAALVASASGYKTVRLWRAGTGECVQVLKGHSGEVSSVAFSPDGALVASTSNDSTVRLWRAGTGRCVQVLKGHSTWVNSVAFSPDAALVASASYDKTVRLWRAGTGECVQVLKGHSGWVNSAAFSPDADLVASASYDSTVRLWRAETGECVQVLKGHSGWVNSVAFSPDAALVASASGDKTVRLWRAGTGECIHEEELGTVAYQLAFDLDGLRLFMDAGSMDIRRSQTLVTALSGNPTHQYISSCDSNRHIGPGFSRDRCWVTWNGKNLLWLPAEFRPVCSMVSASTVAIGCSSGRVIIMGFSAEELD